MLKLPALVLLVFLPALTLTARFDGIPAQMGDWAGTWVETNSDHHLRNPRICAQVLAIGGDRFRVRFYEELYRGAEVLFEGEGALVDGVISVEGGHFSCRITENSLTGAARYRSKEPVAFQLVKADPQSPTLGLPAPEGALVLFDGSNMNAWKHVRDGKDIDSTWEVVDGALQIASRTRDDPRGGNLRTREEFRDFTLHLEFMLPYLPEEKGQGRANSGVYLQHRYELQILDSYALEGNWSECGSLYKVIAPSINHCAAPGVWQTFDVTFRAARFDAEGNLLERARVTVLQNGAYIHKDQEIFENTHHLQDVRRRPPTPGDGPILIQDHGHAVRFRNIWIVPDGN